MASQAEIAAATNVISSRIEGCEDAQCIDMIPPPEGNCTCALIALLALEAAARAAHGQSVGGDGGKASS